jgi:hypothetical protein
MVARSGRLLALGLAVVLTSCSGTPFVDSSFDRSTVTVIASAVQVTGDGHFESPADAALAVARAQRPDLVDPRLTRMVGIYADSTTVDLRVQIQAEGFCHWYGVAGRVQDGALEWRAQSALPCSP